LLQTIKEQNHFQLILVKADGARGRFVKAPAEHEPAMPEFTDTLIPIVSAKILSLPLTEKIAHRVERISKLTGLDEHDEIRPEHIARLISSTEGSLKNAGTAKVVPLINMVDYVEQETLAREAAKIALTMTDRFDCVVLAAMKQEHPIVDVISR
jgi:probable selenium-dependent hydroxylase accessory protein YqeC